MRFFRRMTVAQAAGVGGGSLTYSSVAVEASPDVFTQGWPPEITYAELKPYYDTVAREMNLQVVPDGQLTHRFKLAREAARNLGYADRFSKAPLSVSFSEDWNYQLEDPFNPKHSRQFVNAHGQTPGDVHPSGQLRHRLRRAGEEQPRRQLHSASRAARRRGAAAASGSLHRAAGRQVPGRLRSHRERADDSRRGDRRARRPGRGKPGNDGAPAPLPRSVPDAARAQPDARHALERQRELHLDGHVLGSGSRQAIHGPDHRRACWISRTAASRTSASSSKTTGFRTCCSTRSRRTSTTA